MNAPRSSDSSTPRLSAARLVIFLLPTLAAFGPFIPGVGSIFAFRVASILLFLIALFGRKDSKRSGLRQLTVALTIVWGLAALVSLTLIGPSPQAWSELLSLCTGLALILGFALLPSPPRLLRALLSGWVLAYLVVSVFAVVEFTSGVSMSASSTAERTIDGWGLTVAFFNPNNYATFLLYSFLALLGFWTQARRLSAKILALASLATVPVFMTLTNSRTGLWVLAVFMIVAILVYLRGHVLFRAALVVSTVVIALVALDSMEETPFEELANYIGASGYSVSFLGLDWPVDSSTYVRWELVLAGFALAGVYLLFGAGPGAFESYMAATGGDSRTLGIISPHNGFMEVFSQYGIFVIVIFVIWLTKMLLLGAGVRNSSDRRISSTWVTLLLGVVPLPIVLTMHSSAIEPSTTWLFFALLVAAARMAEAHYAFQNTVDIESSGRVSQGSRVR